MKKNNKGLALIAFVLLALNVLFWSDGFDSEEENPAPATNDVQQGGLELLPSTFLPKSQAKVKRNPFQEKQVAAASAPELKKQDKIVFVGIIVQEEQQHAFIQANQQNFKLKQGEKFLNRYVVKKIHADSIVLQDTLNNQKIILQ